LFSHIFHLDNSTLDHQALKPAIDVWSTEYAAVYSITQLKHI